MLKKVMWPGDAQGFFAKAFSILVGMASIGILVLYGSALSDRVKTLTYIMGFLGEFWGRRNFGDGGQFSTQAMIFIPPA